MKKLILLSLLTISFISCKNTTEKEQNTANKQEVVVTETPKALLEIGCYTYNGNNSHINLEVINLDDEIIGNLVYALDGKDRNSGTFNGQLIDDVLLGTYTFMSEGIESKREVAFLVKDNQLIEGYGQLTLEGTAFADKNNISYTSTMPLTKGNCDK